MNWHSEVVEASRGRTEFVSAAKVEHKAAVIFELAMNKPGKLREPRDILCLCFVAVFLLALESKRRAGEN